MENLICHITGCKLINKGSDLDVMDGPNYYGVEGHPEITWEDWPRGTLWIAVIKSSDWKIRDEKRYFDFTTGKEFIRIGDKYYDKPTNEKEELELNNIRVKYESDRKEKEEEYNRLIKEGKIKDTRIFAKTINLDKVEVRPMGPPSDQIFYFTTTTSND